ncbi:hypothetical protein ABS648_04775 [Pseudomonas solani]|uniref:Uncharacterized protein n=1 Tax=Pseudomonas solani TaxID=2731552 RepID=A0AAU7Y603_9PSED
MNSTRIPPQLLLQVFHGCHPSGLPRREAAENHGTTPQAKDEPGQGSKESGPRDAAHEWGSDSPAAEGSARADADAGRNTGAGRLAWNAPRATRCLNGRGLKRLIYSGKWQVTARYSLKEMSDNPYPGTELRNYMRGIERKRKLLS